MKELYYHDVEQGTAEWLHIKAGKFGGTSAAAILVGGPEVIGAGLRTLIYKKAAELVVGPELDGYTSKDMQRGNDLEPIARERYVNERFQEVKQTGFIQWGEYFGFSPDGLVADDGTIEIKCPAAKTYVEWLDCAQAVGDIPLNYFAQIQWGLFISGRKWCDYIVYHPKFAPNDLAITRVEPDPVTFKKFEAKCELIRAEMDRIQEVIAQKEAV
ncbi:MAG: YqaJ viral recombinase family protein [Phaeodactylibacter sp.]|nr:YqaJ viral recombinase family protein [Phaeodactylibacter sp.]